MEIVYTLILLAVLFFAAFVLRRRWPRLARPVRTRFLAACLLLAAPLALSLASGYDTASPLLNNLLLWDRVLLYLAVLLLFTLLHPRWLTSLIAFVLVLPLLSASALGRLSGLFSIASTRTQHTGAFVLATVPWTSGEHENSGIDFSIARQLPTLPFLRHGVAGGRLYNSQCQTSAVALTLDPAHHLLHLHCPPLPDSSAPSGTDLSFPMP